MKNRFIVLDVFRGLFAVMVTFYHMSHFTNTILINNKFFENADLFVDFFFVLSGFVIALNYEYIPNTTYLFSFFKKRFLRLYPLHFFILSIFLFIEFSKSFLQHYVHVNELVNKDNNIYTYISSLLLLNSIKLPHIDDVSWNTASWSISAEVVSYVLYGIVAFFIDKFKIIRIKRMVCFFIILTSFTLLYLVNHTFFIIYTYDFGFLRSIAGFFTGVFAFSIYSDIKPNATLINKSVFTILEIITLAIGVIMIYNGSLLKKYGFVYEAIILLTVLIFSFEKGIISIWLTKINLLKILGERSYSIYMVHTLGISLFNVIFIRMMHFTPFDYCYLFILNIVLIYLIAGWTFKNIEMKFIKKKQIKGF